MSGTEADDVGGARTEAARTGRVGRLVDAAPSPLLISSSALFHYLGPSLAVLLFGRVGPLGVAWLRIVSAAVVLLVWRRPFRILRRAGARRRALLLAMGAVLAVMNALFYLAIARLPLATVGAIEFLGVISIALAGTRTLRNLAALVLAVGGVAVLADIRLADEPAGFLFAFGNAAGFALYIVLGHRLATTGPDDAEGNDPDTSGETLPPHRRAAAGIDQLAICMAIGAVVVTPIGIGSAAAAFPHPVWLLWGIGVGVCSSVIPYVTDQLAMAKVARATFALMLSLLPAAATVIGLVVLRQVPTIRDLVGVAAVIVGLVVRRDADPAEARRAREPKVTT